VTDPYFIGRVNVYTVWNYKLDALPIDQVRFACYDREMLMMWGDMAFSEPYRTFGKIPGLEIFISRSAFMLMREHDTNPVYTYRTVDSSNIGRDNRPIYDLQLMNIRKRLRAG